MNVWTYWEGPQPPYIANCLETIRRHCREECCYRHVTPERFDQFIPEGTLHPRWKDIPQLGVKSDCVRAAVLARYGGLYVDADTVMLRSPVGVIDPEVDCEFMTWPRPPTRVIAGYVAMRPGSPVAAGWLENVNAFLEQGRIGWTDLGERCLTPAVVACPGARQIPLNTFLPVDIDHNVERFFTPDDYRRLVAVNTVAFGLNHSWMSARQPRQLHANGRLMIHQLLAHAQSVATSHPKITVCCPTFRRPETLAKLIFAFEQQTYQNRELIVLDDSGELTATEGDRWRVLSSSDRSPSLGAKRNRLARMVSSDTELIVPWDDDDIPMPWALSAIAAAARHADWIRPSLVLLLNGKKFIPMETWARPDRSDKGFHPSWGYTVGAFWAAGGYPENVSLGEDLMLARALRDLGVDEADPLALGFEPYYLVAPWDNEHFSYTHKNYTTWPGRLPAAVGEVFPEDHGLNLNKRLIEHRGTMKRSVQTDWWGDAVQ